VSPLPRVLGPGLVLLSGLLLQTGCATIDPVAVARAAERDDREIVVVLHGLGRSHKALRYLEERFEEAGYAVVRVGYRSVQATPDEILAEAAMQIDACCARSPQTVHFVGHSLGGLVIRAYLQEHEVRSLGRVVLLGTPNQGSVLIDRYRDAWWLQLLGDTALALGTGEGSLPRSLGPPDYPVGVIAGRVDGDWNDDRLPGPDDGVVAVDSTRLEGMSDFVVIDTGHYGMRYDERVAGQAVAFLQTGAFLRAP